jgi:RluA family pseudouridine synthase
LPPALDGERLDRVVSLLASVSRTRASAAISAGGVLLDGVPVTTGSKRVAAGQRIVVRPIDERVELPKADPSITFPVVFEDEAIIVLGQARRTRRAPRLGHEQDTLVNGLLARFPEIASVGQPERPGIVHRLDRGTSGLMVVARRPEAYEALVAALAARLVTRVYTALVWGVPASPHGVVDAPIGRSAKDPERMAVSQRGKPARTRYDVVQTFRDPAEVALLTCRLETGRTHQIRVHLDAIGHPVVDDPAYHGVRAPLAHALGRPFLHAARLAFVHPMTQQVVEFTSPLPAICRGCSTGWPDADRSAGAGSVVVAVAGGPRALAAGHGGDVGQRVAPEVRTHVLTHHVPDGQQDALALVVAGAVLVRLAEVAERDGSVHGAHDVGQADLRRRSGEDVAPTHAALGAHQTGALQREEDLLQVRLGEAGAFGDVPHGGGTAGVGVQRERQQGPARIVTSRGHPHHAIVRLSAAQPDGWASRPAPSQEWRRHGGGWYDRPPMSDADSEPQRSTPRPAPLLPDYGGACLSGIVPALLGPGRSLPAWMPAPVHQARQVVLFVLDGLGWEQLAARRAIAPTLSAMTGGPAHSVAPTTTATALSSITTGLPPGEHGVIGYRIDVHGDILNVLRWATPKGDARRTIPPDRLQPVPPFLGMRPPIVTKTEFSQSGFTLAHLAGARQHGWRVPSTLVANVGRLLREGERFVYAYYDGVDKVAHEYGLGEVYDAEVRFADRMVADLLSVLPPGAVLLVTADHGQVDVGDRIVAPTRDVLDATRLQSGEGRFRWLHARPGAAAALLDAAQAHADVAWVVTKEQTLDERWFGAHVLPQVAGRLGDVALVPFEPVSFDDPADSGPYELIARHGSLTSGEMLVPLLAGGPEG